jgi:hypothetical protein
VIVEAPAQPNTPATLIFRAYEFRNIAIGDTFELGRPSASMTEYTKANTGGWRENLTINLDRCCGLSHYRVR